MILFCSSDGCSKANTINTTQSQLRCKAKREKEIVWVRLTSFGEVISVHNKLINAVPAIIAVMHHV
jgi:hypothetical protein